MASGILETERILLQILSRIESRREPYVLITSGIESSLEALRVDRKENGVETTALSDESEKGSSQAESLICRHAPSPFFVLIIPCGKLYLGLIC